MKNYEEPIMEIALWITNDYVITSNGDNDTPWGASKVATEASFE